MSYVIEVDAKQVARMLCVDCEKRFVKFAAKEIAASMTRRPRRKPKASETQVKRTGKKKGWHQSEEAKEKIRQSRLDYFQKRKAEQKTEEKAEF